MSLKSKCLISGLLFAFIFIISIYTVKAQLSLTPNTSYSNSFSDSLKKKDLISPKKVLIRSAVIPGWGQLTNRHYLKLPVIYAGLGAGIYFIYTYNANYRIFKEAFILRTDDDPLTIDQFDPVGGTSEDVYSTSVRLQQERDAYRRNLELSILATTGVYLLNLIDAYVGAHLREFDVKDDLSVRLEMPAALFSYDKKSIIYSGLTFTF